MGVSKMGLEYYGASPEQLAELEARVSEFEESHEDDVIHGGSGWVDVIRRRDFIIALVINSIITAYYIFTMLS